ncbi:MAG: hypothetical protein R2778_08515 [Saprospiraceae bacterium]
MGSHSWNDNYLAGGHNGAWGQVPDTEPMKAIPGHVAITYDATSQGKNYIRTKSGEFSARSCCAQ